MNCGLPGIARFHCAVPPVPLSSTSAAGSASSAQPGMPKPSSSSGSANGPLAVLEKPIAKNARLFGRPPSRTLNVVLSDGAVNGLLVRDGTPSAPAQPAPYGT